MKSYTKKVITIGVVIFTKAVELKMKNVYIALGIGYKKEITLAETKRERRPKMDALIFVYYLVREIYLRILVK